MNSLTKTLKTIIELAKQVRPSISFAKGRSGIEASNKPESMPFLQRIVVEQ